MIVKNMNIRDFMQNNILCHFVGKNYIHVFKTFTKLIDL